MISKVKVTVMSYVYFALFSHLLQYIESDNVFLW
jgi:hypothetical protein